MNDYFEKVINYHAEVELCRIKSVIPPTFSLFDILQYPEKLYKFRSGKKHDYKALIEEYVWLDAPTSFLDPEDARINLGQDDNCETAQKNQAELTKAIAGYAWESARQMFEKCHLSKKTFVTLIEKKSTEDQSEEDVKKQFAVYVSTLPTRDRKKATEQLSKIITSFHDVNEKVDAQRAGIISSFQNETKICCFTDSFDNRSMWENYAGRYSGFVLEYSKPNVEKLTSADLSLILSILPVSYYDNPPHVDITQIFVDLASNNGKLLPQDETRAALANLYKQIITKRMNYQEEREWRLIRGNTEKNEFPFPYISAVYAGYKIKPHNLARLKNICRAKGIKLYKQELDPKEKSITYTEC